MQQRMQSGSRHVQLKCTLTQRRLMPSISCHERAPSVPCGVKVGLCSAWEVGGAMGTITTHMVECTSEGCCSYSTRSAPYCRPDLGIHPCRSSRAECHTQLTVLSAVGIMGSHMCREMKLTLLTRCTLAENAQVKQPSASWHWPPRFPANFVSQESKLSQ